MLVERNRFSLTLEQGSLLGLCHDSEEAIRIAKY